ncbi:glyoxalase family protein [Peribacillus deserti]|uniref:Glyoxalase family protein n=1 Tax=Peribacillus deserti TaxID=673318 RepID=A0ABS2QHV2_9BACI|nr:ring-cleaving dioxygenase [Peribacillus deserti]MBM7692717.1 glyoxalase family protein [Peribacillus deserti]
MQKRTAGIHHITAIVGNPQENVDFYAGVLGLRLVKKTVNFDDPGTYHLYFGNEAGSPGTIMTFFPWHNAHSGKRGSGQVGVTSFVVPEGALPFWEERLSTFQIAYEKITRFGEESLQFMDPHGLHLELAARKNGPVSKWTFGKVTPDVAIKGFGGAILLSADPESTMELLVNGMGLEKVETEGDFTRFKSTDDLGNIIDVKQSALPEGSMGVGTVHHIAWRAQDFEDHESWRQHIGSKGYGVTKIVDRQYFNAIYFREKGGILFEIATDPPGFTKDESAETMGENLLLPPWLEEKRALIEANLLPAEVRLLEEDL